MSSPFQQSFSAKSPLNNHKEVAKLLKSNSQGHAAFYLDQLINDGQVVHTPPPGN